MDSTLCKYDKETFGEYIKAKKMMFITLLWLDTSKKKLYDKKSKSIRISY